MAPSVSGCIKLHSLLKDLCGNGMINPSGDVAIRVYAWQGELNYRAFGETIPAQCI